MPRERELETVAPAFAEALRADPNPGFLRATLHGVYGALWMVAAVVGSPWILWRCWRDPGFGRMIRERSGWVPVAERQGPGPTVLVHGVSVGEVKGAVPLVQAISDRFPELEVVISTTTNTGMAVACELFPDLRVVRFPADITPSIRAFLRRVCPDFVVLIELEIWPNFLRECNRIAVPVAVVNGRITERSHGHYVVFRKLLPQFNRLSLFCVQDERYARRFRDLSVAPERIVVTGSMKADRLKLGPVDPGDELRRLLGGRPGQVMIVAGSTHHPEEQLVVQAWLAGAPEARLVLVPRHPERAETILRDLERLGVQAQTLGLLRSGAQTPNPARPCLVDTIGELERIYGLADLVFVGGSLVDHGGQNMLEPAAQGRAVVFGPSVTNFAQEATLLVDRGACLMVRDAEQLGEVLGALAADPDRREDMAELGLEAVRAQKGATAVTLEALVGIGLGHARASRTG